jgi:perosamine synthetase
LGDLKYPVGCPDLGPFEASAVAAVMASGHITHGPAVRQFERLLAAHLGVKHAIACSSGTTALHMACSAFFGPGDEVLVPDVTYVATANAVTYTGADPVFVDIMPDTWNIDLRDAEHRITDRTRGIVVVHLYGVPCNMDEVHEFARKHGLVVIEDAAEALGGQWNGKPCGTFGNCGTFSFYGNKIITTGEGGAVVTNDDSLADEFRLLRGQGQSLNKRFWHELVGYNYRMTDLQAAVGIVQMQRLGELLAARRHVIGEYRALIKNRLDYPRLEGTAPWLFTGLVDQFDNPVSEVMRRMLERGVETRPVFVPMHRLPMYQARDEDFPVACYVADHGISLPTHSQLVDRDVRFITSVLLGALS